MRKDHVSSLPVVAFLKELGGRLVGEVTNAREYPLFNCPGVRPVPQHFKIVVGFEQEQVDALELGLDVGRDIAQIGGKAHSNAFGTKDKAHRVGGVVGGGEGAYGNVADFEGLAGLKVLDTGKPGGVFLAGGRPI